MDELKVSEFIRVKRREVAKTSACFPRSIERPTSMNIVRQKQCLTGLAMGRDIHADSPSALWTPGNELRERL